MRVPAWIVPLGLLLALGAGIGLAHRLPFATYCRDFADPARLAAVPAGRQRTVTMVVRNLRCRGRSMQLAKFLAADPGILRLSTFVGMMHARILYDAGATDVERLRRLVETEVEVKVPRPPASPGATDATGLRAVTTAELAELTDTDPREVKRIRPFTVLQVVSD